MDEWERIAYDFARRKHDSQLDDDGISPYFNSHILHVVAILKCVTNDHDIITAAYLHDTLEDTETKYEEIANLFGGRVAGLVYELTHEGKDSSTYYFPRLSTREAVMIKFADRLSNLSRMAIWEKPKQESYLRKSKFWKSE